MEIPWVFPEGLPLAIPALLCSRSHRRGENQGGEARSQRVRKELSIISLALEHQPLCPTTLRGKAQGQLVQLTKASFRDQSVSAVLGRARKPQPLAVTWAAGVLWKSLYPHFCLKASRVGYLMPISALSTGSRRRSSWPEQTSPVLASCQVPHLYPTTPQILYFLFLCVFI